MIGRVGLVIFGGEGAVVAAAGWRTGRRGCFFFFFPALTINVDGCDEEANVHCEASTLLAVIAESTGRQGAAFVEFAKVCCALEQVLLLLLLGVQH